MVLGTVAIRCWAVEFRGMLGHWVISGRIPYHRAQLEEPSEESRFKQGETDMGDKGKKDKGKKEQQKKALRNLKEKRIQKNEKKK